MARAQDHELRGFVIGDRLPHACLIRTHHLPLPYSFEEHHLIPRGWQRQLYDHVQISDTIKLCPTHHRHAHLALDAAVAEICFSHLSVFDRRQFGRELWAYAEDSALWLRSRIVELPDFEWWTVQKPPWLR